jgi:hypothetical protein
MSELIGPNPCVECSGEYGQHLPGCPMLDSRLTAEDRIERLERIVAELQRHLREFNGFAPSRELDLIDLP